ncbi:MAG: hypothetical protein JW822_13745 [Spirochaetales bacterium]|nr:hypothetical protein [Spirochaetales bacterium]
MKKDYINKIVDKFTVKDMIPKKGLTNLCSGRKEITIKKNEFFLRAGVIPDRIGFNLAGLLRFWYIDDKGAEVIKHFCLKNAFHI